jgi:mRNA-degrading endonuclease toxin of MazEF toxin-antitoxin module
MRQWDIYLYSFQQEHPHPVVILSNDEICANPHIQFVNGLLCTSVRADRPLKRREALLDAADGLDRKTAVRCDFIYALSKALFQACRGRVSDARQIELLRKIRFCFRWPLV